MAGLDPVIHAAHLPPAVELENTTAHDLRRRHRVDGRVKPGHDEISEIAEKIEPDSRMLDPAIHVPPPPSP